MLTESCSIRRCGRTIVALGIAVACASPSWGQVILPYRVPELSRINTGQVAAPKGPQSGLSYLWSRRNDVSFGPNDPGTFAKQLILPAGTWQISAQFQALLTDGVDSTSGKIAYASVSCQFIDAAGGRSTTLIATPAMFRHNPSTADYYYDMSSLQTLNLGYIFASDGQAIGSVALLCTPSARNNSIVMQNLTISAIPIAGVVREQE